MFCSRRSIRRTLVLARVAMTNRTAHPPTEESNEQIYLFLESFLKPAKP